MPFLAPASAGTTGRCRSNDFVINSAAPGILAKIASIQIGGQAIGTVDGSGSFGIEAEQIGSLSVNGVSYHLTPGPHNDFDVLVGDSGNLVLFEL
jgi:hypothetical protein